MSIYFLIAGALNTNRYKYMMSNYKHVGSYTKSKGVIVLYNKIKQKLMMLQLNKKECY